MVQARLEAEGSLEDFDDSRKAIIQGAFAAHAGVTSDKVTVSVLSGSVIIEVSIQFNNTDAATSVQASLATTIGSEAAASTFLSAANVQVVNAPSVVGTTALVVAAASPPPSAEADGGPDLGEVEEPLPGLDLGDVVSRQSTGTGDSASAAPVIIGGVVAFVLLILLLVGAFVWCKSRKPKRQGMESIPAGIGMVSSTTGSSSTAKSPHAEVSVEIGSPKQPLSPQPGSPVPGSPSATPRRSASPVPPANLNIGESSTADVLESAIAKLNPAVEETKI